MMPAYIVSIKDRHHKALRWFCRNGILICLSHLMIGVAKAKANSEPLNEPPLINS